MRGRNESRELKKTIESSLLGAGYLELRNRHQESAERPDWFAKQLPPDQVDEND
jgi:hypothetical protein